MDGPCLRYVDGSRRYCINGIDVPEVICETPAEELDPQLYFQEQNIEVRLAILQKMGMERIFDQLNYKVLDTLTVGEYAPLLADFTSRPEPLPAWATVEGVDGGTLNTSAPCYELLDIELDLGERGMQSVKYLRMGNPSEDKTHIEAVTPDCTTVQEALAFRAGLSMDIYLEPEALS
jgi:hypothetical protein